MKDNTIIQKDEAKQLSIEIPLMVNTYDIDVAGHLNNIVYVRWLEDLRNKLFTEFYSLKELLQNNYYPVVVASELNYRKQIKLFDKPVGKISLKECSHEIYVLKADILVDRKIVFTANQRCIIMDIKNNKMCKRNIDDLLKSFNEEENNMIAK